MQALPVGAELPELTSTDGKKPCARSHPSKAGNYLAACVFYSSFYNEMAKKADRKVPDAIDLAKIAASARPKALPYPLP